MKLTRKELFYGTNTRTKISGKGLDSNAFPYNPRNPYELPANIDRLAWYKTRAEQLAAMKDTELVLRARRRCADRIMYLEYFISREVVDKVA